MPPFKAILLSDWPGAPASAALGLIGVNQIAFSLRRIRALVRVSHFRHAWAWSLGIAPWWDIRDRSSAAWPRNESQSANLLRSSLRSIIRVDSR